MKKESCYFFASISKTFKTDGSLIIKNNKGLEEISKEEPMFIEFNDILVPFFIEEFELKNNFTAILKFESLYSEEQAKDYIGKPIYIEGTKSSIEDSFNFDLIINFKVFDSNGNFIGIAADYNLIPGNPVLFIIQDEKEIIFPFNEELIIEIDSKAKKIVFEVPDGLVDLYIKD